MKDCSGLVDLFVTFYQNGIMRAQLVVNGEEQRFAISSTDIGVNWDTLQKVTDLYPKLQFRKNGVWIDLQSMDGNETISYYLQYKPFRIAQYVNGYCSAVANNFDTLTFKAPNAPHDTYYIENDQIVTGYEIGIDIILQSEKMWGIP